jgi:hypothetical protein
MKSRPHESGQPILLTKAILKVRAMRLIVWFLLLVTFGFCASGRLYAQLPFYTDDTGVTERGKWHFEFFDEYDALQLQYPNVKQNTANFKLNYGLPHNLEVDLDSPYLSIYRTAGNPPSTGVGDTNMGLKANFRKESPTSRAPALAVSFYVELPTGDASQQLGSGLSDYWLNLYCTKVTIPKNPDRRKFRIFVCRQYEYRCAGDPNHNGSCYPGRAFASPRFSSFAYAWRRGFRRIHRKRKSGKIAVSSHGWGGQYVIRKGLTFCVGILGGKYVASPRIGGQIGFAIDFP